MNGEPHADELYLMLGTNGCGRDARLTRGAPDRSVITVEVEDEEVASSQKEQVEKRKKYIYIRREREKEKKELSRSTCHLLFTP